jgi:hypothetical protein
MTERDALEQIREHYAMMAELFDKLERGDEVRTQDNVTNLCRPATYADWSQEMRCGMALCARVLSRPGP